MDKFEQWFMKEKSTKENFFEDPVPLLTEILYNICANDVEKFDRVCDMM